MKPDERNLPLSTDSTEAARLFDRAVEHYLKYHTDTMALVGKTIVADADFVMAHCLKGYLLLGAANPAHRQQIVATLAVAQSNAATATQREKLHVAAFAAWAAGELDRSFAIWRQILDATPTDLLALRICDTTWFRHGQTQKIREQADRIVPRWSSDLPGYDLAQCVWAFAHEETGDYAAAEHAVDAALEQDRTNYFAHHVKAHVLEMDCRPREGCHWLQSQIPNWLAGNNLIHHLWWHRTLMELDLGDRDAVLASYDANIRNFDDPITKAVPDHYVDLQNATALLWRLELLGLDVDHRWDELADKAEARIGDAGHLLLVPHLMLALAATGRDETAGRYLAALHELAADSALWTAPAIAGVVIPACEAALAHRRGDHARVVDLLEPRQNQIRLLGGSNAQRDLFFQMLIDSAMKAGRHDVVSAMIAHETATRSVPPAQRAGYTAPARWLHS
jgi:tetratricopeptide (TPR) repeat protein